MNVSAFVTTMTEWCAAVIETVGVGLIAVLALYALLAAAFQKSTGQKTDAIFRQVRLRLGHGILLGLEFLVAAEIIHTVAVELTFKTVGVLAIIVVIRTFLSFTLNVELTGRWPWQEEKSS